MSDEPESPKATRLPWRWWAGWWIVLLLALVIPFLHWHYQVGEIIEPLRYQLGLLPAHWLIFRWTGEIANLRLIIVFLAGVWAWFQRKWGKALILVAAIVALASVVAGAVLTGRLMVAFIHEEVSRVSEEPLRQDTGPEPTPPNEESAFDD